MATTTTLDDQIDLMLGIERLLAEAERVRTLRDRLFAAARADVPPTPREQTQRAEQREAARG